MFVMLTVLASIAIMLTLVMILTAVSVLRVKEKSFKQRMTRALLRTATPVISEIELELENGSVDKYPTLKKELNTFVEMYSSCINGKNVGVEVNLRKLLKDTFIEEDKKYELWFQDIQKEMLSVTNKNLIKYFAYKVAFINLLVMIKQPRKYQFYMYCLELKKNPLVRNLREFELLKGSTRERMNFVQVDEFIEENVNNFEFSKISVKNKKDEKLKIAQFNNFSDQSFVFA